MIHDDKPSLEDLMHYGVKGQRWGVRNVHLEKVKKATDKLDRVASGTASTREKLSVAARTSLLDLATQGGLKGASAKNSQILKDHAARVEAGKSTIRDGLLVYGGVSARDLVKAASIKK